jgi:hypothetical protein
MIQKELIFSIIAILLIGIGFFTYDFYNLEDQATVSLDSTSTDEVQTDETQENQPSPSSENNNELVKDNPVIREIITNPNLYKGKEVTINGKYGGWTGRWENCDLRKTAMYTRSDVIIYDETGCLYMYNVEILYNEYEKPLEPWDNDALGSNVTVRGVISLIDGKPYISVE